MRAFACVANASTDNSSTPSLSSDDPGFITVVHDVERDLYTTRGMSLGVHLNARSIGFDE